MYNHSVIIINSSYKKSIMKSYLSKLSVLLLGAMFAVVGCQDYDEDIRKINDQLSANVTDLNSIIDELEDEIAELEKLAATHATKEELDALKTQLQGDLANVKKALEDAYKAADAELNTKIEAAKKAAQDALEQKAQVLEGQIDGVKKDVAAVYTYIETELIPLVNKAINDAVSASAETLRGEIAKAVTDLTAKDNALQASLNEAIGRIDKNAADILALQTDLKAASDAVKKAQEDILKNAADIEAEKQAREQAVAALKTAYEAKVAQLEADLLANVAALNAEKAAREAADAALRAEYAAADAALKAALEKTINSNASAIAALQTKVAALESKVAELQTKVAQVLAKVEANEATITDLGKQIDALEESVLKTLENLENKVEDLATALRSVVVVPETMYNGTKAVKFHRVEGENVLKTFAYVSFHFNPGNFDVESAEYEVMAENVEFMTRAAAPAIEIVGKPVKEGDKVTFLFERAEGAGNMFALKATLADGSVVYSEYVAILDEANYVTATANVSVEVERLALEIPTINSLSSLIETIKGVGTAIENYQAYIDAIQASYEAAKAGNMLGALQAFTNVPGLFTKQNAVVTGVASHTVKVETMTAETLFEDIMNASSIYDLMAQLEALIGKAEGLGGEKGAEILETLKQLANNNELGDLMGKLEDTELELDFEESIREAALATLERDKANLEKFKAEVARLEAEGANALVLGAAKLAVTTGEGYVATSQKAYDAAVAIVDSLKAKIEEYTEELLDKAKDYIEQSEIGQAIKNLENAIGEQGWEGKKMVAETDAKVVASAEAIKDLIANYNALNKTVVDEFNNSLFGKLLSIIQTQEAADAFAQLNLTPLYEALKQLPEIATMITKYYPSGMTSIDGALGLLGGLTPEVAVEWSVDYELAQ